ncbi:hypothetical protein [Streptomyces sp. AN091965]|nr:hypothetical protein [Streptomyces sp. AN091965]MCI3928145.1 hypothetical protein [Streptomyces sp. AN091965]
MGDDAVAADQYRQRRGRGGHEAAAAAARCAKSWPSYDGLSCDVGRGRRG